jgi:hypothetical protein
MRDDLPPGPITYHDLFDAERFEHPLPRTVAPYLKPARRPLR